MIQKIHILILIEIIIGMFLHSEVKAQQDAQFTQFAYTQQYFNPAVVGAKLETNFSFTHRNQWLAYQPSFDNGGAPSTQLLIFNTALPKYNSGIGVHIVNDRLGALNNLEVQLSYAYHVKVGEGKKLSFGLRGGMYAVTIDGSALRFRQPNDPYASIAGKETNLKPDFAAGIYYQTPKFFAGANFNHLNQAGFNFGEGIRGQTLARSMYILSGYNWEIEPEKWTLTPIALLKSTNFKVFSVEAGALLTYNKKFTFGTTYRHEESVNAIVSVELPRKTSKNIIHNMRIGYAFDYIIGGQSAKQPTSHEITLSYQMPVKLPLPPSIIRSPRFRY
ncbi:MAG: type IX secretion system membrane protein PorP/SprF [Cytophagales bacterium]|nr:MAG: type IX secretion system membrane protein PorP/SprF [Cytophagales bacterium]